MATRKLYQILATHLDAIENCKESSNTEWQDKHADTVAALVINFMPHGGGFDSGTNIDMDASRGGDKLIFTTAFHHMDEHGSYDGWTEHTVTIKSCLAFDFSLNVSGRNRNDIKDYISECFANALHLELKPDSVSGSYKLAA